MPKRVGFEQLLDPMKNFYFQILLLLNFNGNLTFFTRQIGPNFCRIQTLYTLGISHVKFDWILRIKSYKKH